MKAAVFHEHGSSENIKWEDFPDPECGPEDAVIKVGAAGLNGFEPMVLLKTTALKTPLPMIVAGDSAGEIVELGDQRLRAGRSEIGCRSIPWSRAKA